MTSLTNAPPACTCYRPRPVARRAKRPTVRSVPRPPHSCGLRAPQPSATPLAASPNAPPAFLPSPSDCARSLLAPVPPPAPPLHAQVPATRFTSGDGAHQRPQTRHRDSSRDDPKSNRVPMCRSRAHNPRTSAAPPCPLSPPSRRPPAQRGQAPHRAARDRGWLGWRLGRGGGLHRAPRALPRASPPASSAPRPRRAPLAVHPPAAGPRRGSREARASAQTPPPRL